MVGRSGPSCSDFKNEMFEFCQNQNGSVQYEQKREKWKGRKKLQSESNDETVLTMSVVTTTTTTDSLT